MNQKQTLREELRYKMLMVCKNIALRASGGEEIVLPHMSDSIADDFYSLFDKREEETVKAILGSEMKSKVRKWKRPETRLGGYLLLKHQSERYEQIRKARE